jgi:hypothetical protein
MNITTLPSTAGAEFPISATPDTANQLIRVTTINATSAEISGEYLKIVIDGKIRGTVRIVP